MRPRVRYLGILVATALAAIGVAAAVNLAVDPYGYFQLLRLPGINVVKPRPDHDLREIKRAAVERVHPNALILGNSRAEVGFDPEHGGWSSRGLSAYNFALPGSAIRTTWEVFDELQGTLEPKLAVIGVEFLDFLADPAVLDAPALVRGPRSSWNEAARLAGALFTWNALSDSARTLSIQRASYPATITPRGFNPLLEYVETARRDGYYALFRQRAGENAAQYARKPRTVRRPDGHGGAAFDYLRAILRAARARGTEVHRVIYPYHAQLLLMFEDTGLWPAFEDWKRQLVALVDDERSGTRAPVVVWDFSSFTPYTTEDIPPPGDLATTTRWYWEGGHFKRALGDVMLSQVLGTAPDGFGTPLDGRTIDERLASLRAQRDSFRLRQPALARDVLSLVEAANRRENR